MHAADAHASPPPAEATEPAPFRVHAPPLALRLAQALLQVLGTANLLYLAARFALAVVAGEPLPPPVHLALWLLLLSGAPVALARLLRAWTAASVEVHPTQLVVRTRRAWFEVPLSVLAGVRPWRVPLPGAGLSLRLTSGRTFRRGLQLRDPTPLLTALGRVHPAGTAALAHPSTRFAHARSAALRRRGLHLALAFGLFPLLPTAVHFVLDQNITYGGPLGGYRLLGLGAYLRSLVLIWLNTTAQLVLYASLWRALTEGVSLLAAWAAPAWAGGVRKTLEWASRLAYYVGVPAFIAWLLLR